MALTVALAVEYIRSDTLWLFVFSSYKTDFISEKLFCAECDSNLVPWEQGRRKRQTELTIIPVKSKLIADRRKTTSKKHDTKRVY